MTERSALETIKRVLDAVPDRIHAELWVDANTTLGAFVDAALSASPAGVVKPLEDLEEVRKAVFGDVGDDPDVYADYDRCSELSSKMRKAIEALRSARIMSAIEPAGVGMETSPPENHLRVKPLQWVKGWAYGLDLWKAAGYEISRSHGEVYFLKGNGIDPATFDDLAAAQAVAQTHHETHVWTLFESPSPQPRASVPAALKGDEQ